MDSSDDSLHVIEKHVTVPADRQQDAVFKNGTSDQIRALENPMARQIVDAMKAAGEPYSFLSTDDLLENILFRLAAMQAFQNCNAGTFDMDYYNQDVGLKPRVGTTGASGVSQYWSFLNPGDLWDAEWIQNADTVPSLAMASEPGATMPFRGECAGAFQMAVYFGLLNGLGVSRFDEMAKKFGTMYIGPWSVDDGKTPNPATLYMQKASLADAPIPGDYMYFKNKDDYLKWAPEGFWTGLNAMYMGKDALGTPHYSGMGASWLSEVNLRASLVNAYYHDCSPHTIDDPNTEVRFTIRRTLVIPKDLEAALTDTSKGSSSKPAAPALKAQTLVAAGFTQHEPDLFEHADMSLGQVAETLGVDLSALRQVPSAGLENPPHRIMTKTATVIVTYHDSTAARRDPEARVQAVIKLTPEDGKNGQ
ncbi:hypothetical protein ACXYMO_06735 [Arenibacterium sp. CAU 1754]